MDTNYIKCTLERFLPFPNRSYVAQFAALALICQGLVAAVAACCGPMSYRLCEMLFVVHIAVWPIFQIYLSRSFRSATDATSTLFWSDKEAFEGWYAKAARRAFTLYTVKARVMIMLMSGAAVCTLMHLHLPASSAGTNCLAFLIFLSVVLIGAYWAHVLSELAFILREIAQRTPAVPFFWIPYPHLTRLHSYFMNVSALTTVAYGLLAATFWVSPYGVNGPLFAWLSVLALFPLGIFSISTLSLRQMTQGAKAAHVQTVNKELLSELEMLTVDHSKGRLDAIRQLMDIQALVQSTKESPINIQGGATLLLSLLAPAAQIAMAVLRH